MTLGRVIFHCREGFDEDRLNALIPDDIRQSTQEPTNVTNCNKSAIVHLNCTGKFKTMDTRFEGKN